jgi:hypothetical protein
MTTAPAAGWYLDPTARNRNRYWDGSGWTERAGSNWQEIVDPLSIEPDPPTDEAPKKSVLEALRLKRQRSRATADRYQGEQVLLQVGVSYVASGILVRAMLIATDQNVLMDECSTKSGVLPMLGFPLVTVTGIVVEAWSAARSEYGWKLSTGFLHGPDRVAATSGIALHLECGADVLLRVHGEAPLARTRFEPLIRSVEGRHPSSDAPSGGDRYEHLRKLAHLRDEGILTEREFDNEKSKILNSDS